MNEFDTTYLDSDSDETPSIGSAPEFHGFENLLEMDEEDAARRIIREWNNTQAQIDNFAAEWKANVASDQGYTGVRVIKEQDKNVCYIPYGSSPNIVGLNKGARLKRRLRSIMFGDPPLPEATPSSDEDVDKDAAELSTRVLQDLSGEGGLDYTVRAGDAFDLGGNYGSGFLWFTVDPRGGGNRPKTLFAAPNAVDAANPLVDPETGLSQGFDPVTKYVTDKGQLTDNRPPNPELQWLPSLKVEEMTGKNVRFIPSTARDIWDADGFMVAQMVPLSAILNRYPDLRDMEEGEREELLSPRPANANMLMPKNRKQDSATPDEKLVFTLTRYHKQSPLYPKGACLIVLGDKHLAFRDVWYDKRHDQPLDLPITQFKQFTEEDNPYGRGIMSHLRAGNEIRGMIKGNMLEQQDKTRNRKIFVSIGSNLQPQQLQDPMLTVIPILPGGEPKYEQVPDFPMSWEKMLASETIEMDDESALQLTAQGVSTPAVQSGRHAEQVIEQVNQALSDLRQNTVRGLVRGWRIMLQLVRAYYPDNMVVKWTGDDGEYRMDAWSAADLGTTRDVQISKGSFSQLAPSSKAALAQSYLESGLLPLSEAQRIIASNVGGTIGVQDDPHRLRVRRQLARWYDGPPDEWQPPEPQTDPQTGQPVETPDPVASQIFDSLPVDEEQAVAIVRANELGRALAGTRFRRKPPAWQKLLLDAYSAARQAAGVVTVAEQQQVQQEASEAAQKESETDRQQEQGIEQMKQSGELEKTQVRAQAELERTKLQTEAQLQGNLLDIAANRGVDNTLPED